MANIMASVRFAYLFIFLYEIINEWEGDIEGSMYVGQCGWVEEYSILGG